MSNDSPMAGTDYSGSKTFTCKSFLAGKDAPRRIELLGNKQRPESAQHIIEFPGGAIELSRTADGDYWAHIIVNREWADTDCRGLRGAIGKVVKGRIDADTGVYEVPGHENITQIALLIRPIR